MRFIREIFTKNFSKIETVLGRWDIKYDTKVIDRKIDQANHDHCGCCEIENIKKNDDNDDKYLIPFMV